MAQPEVAIVQLSFSLRDAELACAIPRAGGVMIDAGCSLARSWGFGSGMAETIIQTMALMVAPAAIGLASGDDRSTARASQGMHAKLNNQQT